MSRPAAKKPDIPLNVQLATVVYCAARWRDLIAIASGARVGEQKLAEIIERAQSLEAVAETLRGLVEAAESKPGRAT